MRGKRHVYAPLIITAVCVYLILILILFGVESGRPDASIRTVGDAIWYSIVTLTTVGYGDLTPVTPIGHVIGIVFLLLSTGILVALVGALVSALSSAVFPLMKLSLRRRKNWYYFADTGLEAVILAKNISEDDPLSEIIFGQGMNSLEEKPDFPCTFINVSPEYIIRLKHHVGNRCRIFFMKKNDIGVNLRAVHISDLDAEVYARTTSGEDSFTGNIHFFHSYDCCARVYWRNRPLRQEEHDVVLIGFGYYGQALLKCAIMYNIISAEQHVTYHIFGNAKEFLLMHPGLGAVFSIGAVSSERDSLIFHQTSWKKEGKVLENTDRIIICADDEPTDWNIYCELTQFYPVRGVIDLRSNRHMQGPYHFGSNDSIYTAKNVIRTNLNQLAVAMNNLYRRENPDSSLDWDELDDVLRQSKIAASEHIPVKIRILLRDESITDVTPRELAQAYEVYERDIRDPRLLDVYRRIEHTRWRRFYAFYNWSFAPERCAQKRRDPYMDEYDNLTPKMKAQGDYSWGLLGILSQQDQTA